MNKAVIGACVMLIAAVTVPVFGQGISEATGEVVDREGNPVQNAVVRIRAKSKPDVPYTAKTNKKGKYFVSGLFTGKENEFWLLEFEAEGLLPVEVRIESRTVNRVLVDEMTTKLGPGRKPPEIIIRPLGKATIDWTVAPADEVAAEVPDVAEAAASAADGPEEPSQTVDKDPWAQALTLAAAGSFDQALEFFAKAVEDEPGDAERYETFAKVLFRLEEFDKAEVQARRAVELDPARVDSQMVLFSVYKRSEDLGRAKAALEAAKKASPKNLRVLERLAYVAEEMGDREGAIAGYLEVTAINPGHAAAWLSLGSLQAEVGNLAESEVAYQKVVEIDPARAHQTYFNIGAVIMKQSDRSPADGERAISAFRKALEIKPDYARAAQELAFALLGSGDKEGARVALETCLKANPNAPGAPKMQALLKNFSQ